jgi:hypothetical protein
MYRLVLGAIFLGFPVAATANEAGSLSLTPLLGYVLADNERQTDDALLSGVTVGEQFTEKLALESSFMKSRHDTDSGNRLSLLALMVDGVYSFHNEQRVSPFVSAGAGIMWNDPSEAKAHESFAAQAGVGARISIWQGRMLSLNLVPHVRARWDARGSPTNSAMVDVLASIGLQWVLRTSEADPPPAPIVARPPPGPVAEPPPTEEGSHRAASNSTADNPGNVEIRTRIP